MNNRMLQKRSVLRAGLVCLMAVGLLPSCALLGGGGEGTWARSEQYTVTAPASWTVREKESSDRAYRLSSGNIATLTSSCNRNPGTPLPLLTKHLLFGTRNLVVERREPITVDGKEGLLSKVRASMDGAKFQMMLVVTVNAGCVFDFTLVSPKDLPERDESEFLTFVRSFRNGKH
jgi:hypothetical protein